MSSICNFVTKRRCHLDSYVHFVFTSSFCKHSVQYTLMQYTMMYNLSGCLIGLAVSVCVCLCVCVCVCV